MTGHQHDSEMQILRSLDYLSKKQCKSPAIQCRSAQAKQDYENAQY